MNDWATKRSQAFGNFRLIEKQGRKMQNLPKLNEWKSKVCESLTVKQIGANHEKGKNVHSLAFLKDG